MNVRMPPADLMWSQAWEAFSPYLLPTLIAAALFVILLLVGRRDERPPAAPQAVPPRPRAAEATVRAAPVETPRPAPVEPPPAAAVPTPAPASGPARLLVVDDSAVVRAKLRKLLEGAGYEVVLANDGHQALALLPTAFFSLLITDLEMPVMSGVELIASVQGSLETEDLPVIAITGHDELQAHVRDCQGLYGLFRKPWNDRELLRRIEALATLRTRPAEAVAARRAEPALG